MRLRPLLTVALAAALAGGAAPAPVRQDPSHSAARPSLRVSESEGLTRLMFHGGAPAVASQAPGELVVRLTKGEPDLGRLIARPPNFVAGATPRRTPGGLELTLKLADGAVVAAHQTPDGLAVELKPGVVEAVAVSHRPDPAPASGVIKVTGETTASGIAYRFDWAAPAGAAVFRRGEALWIVFDAAARLDPAAAPRGKGVTAVSAHAGPGYAALRLTADPKLHAAARAEAARWTVTLSPGAPMSAPVALSRGADGEAALQARLAGATAVRTVADPVVGDTLTVVTALGPAKGLAEPRAFVDFALLSSSHGLALSPLTDGLAVEIAGEHVRFGRPSGLALSAAAGIRADAAAGAPARASLPGLVDFARWSKTGEGGFLARHAALQAAVADAQGPAAREARLALARFLVGSELAHEALGVLNGLKRSEQALAADGELRALHGAANAMVGRHKEAAADFAAPVLATDPASALWRGYVAEQLGDHEGAAAAFAQGAPALPLFAPAWRARFARSAGLAALAQGDLPAARRALLAAAAETVGELETQRTLLAQARLLETEGAAGPALSAYDRLARSPHDAVAAPALLRATELRLKTGAVAPDAAAATLAALRWRWRGDATELDAVRALGRLHLARGQYREGLAALRSAAAGLDSDAGLSLQAELLAAFRGLFLEGGADGLEPIQALGLFYDFRDATPIGAEGDLMVRRLAHRLIDVDLLPQAAELLRYQAKQRLDGVPRAQVSTDLALVLLMDRKPQDALRALNESRSTLLPAALAAERRLIEARALAATGRGDHALEILQADASPEALDVRAEVAWADADWAAAAPLLERALGDRWRGGALSPTDEARLLRAGAAYSLAGDTAALARLRTRWAGKLDAARSPDALRVALAGDDEGPAALARASADLDGFPAWVTAMKRRFRDAPAAG